MLKLKEQVSFKYRTGVANIRAWADIVGIHFRVGIWIGYAVHFGSGDPDPH